MQVGIEEGTPIVGSSRNRARKEVHKTPTQGSNKGFSGKDDILEMENTGCREKGGQNVSSGCQQHGLKKGNDKGHKEPIMNMEDKGEENSFTPGLRKTGQS